MSIFRERIDMRSWAKRSSVPVTSSASRALAEPLKAGLRGIREDLKRSREVLGELGAHILDDFVKLLLAQEVDFGEQYADLRCTGKGPSAGRCHAAKGAGRC
jgi:hypothetical protein